ncbi:MAG: hypothetical protein IJQ99_11610 [Synergistaceae bacterium]|nr:hypothetical protein [Synergistaceae bacterium]MBR0317499.1 hypothetical protein [Synergistaceae bacterium]
MNDTKNQGLYSTETMSKLMNISERRLEQLAKKRIIPKAGRGVYDLGSTVTAYIRYLQGICGGVIKEEPTELDKRLLEAKVLERESKARQAKYRADEMQQNLGSKNLRKEINKLPSALSQRILEWPDDLKNNISVENVIAEAGFLVNRILHGEEIP